MITVELNKGRKQANKPLFYLETGRVGVSTNNGETVSGIVFSTNFKSNNGRAITGEKVLALTLNQAVIPTITLFNFFESCRLEDF